jgi:hypothetical protein
MRDPKATLTARAADDGRRPPARNTSTRDFDASVGRLAAERRNL